MKQTKLLGCCSNDVKDLYTRRGIIYTQYAPYALFSSWLIESRQATISVTRVFVASFSSAISGSSVFHQTAEPVKFSCLASSLQAILSLHRNSPSSPLPFSKIRSPFSVPFSSGVFAYDLSQLRPHHATMTACKDAKDDVLRCDGDQTKQTKSTVDKKSSTPKIFTKAEEFFENSHHKVHKLKLK